MHLSPNICTVLILVCLQLWTIHGQADMQLVKTARNARMRDALSRLNRSPREAARRDRRGALMNENLECWNPCGKKGGSCSYCGDGSCCRQGRTDGAGCDGTNGCNGNHCCVEQRDLSVESYIDNIEYIFPVLVSHATFKKLTHQVLALAQSLSDIVFGGMFMYVSTPANNTAAEAFCVQHGGHLASLDTDEELEYVKEHDIPQDGTKVWLGAECVGCSVVNEDKWQWKSGSKLGLDHPLWAKNYGLYGKDLPYDAISNNAVHLTMLCNGECEFINHAAYTEHPFLCEKSSDGSWKMTNTDRKEGEEEDTMP